MPTSSHPARLGAIAFSAFLISQAGCVALNIPSQRFADPTDQGGVLGHWRGENVGDVSDPAFAGEEVCLDGGALDPDSTFDGGGEPKPPEIPWPRYHPVPTRPVFGSPSVAAGH